MRSEIVSGFRRTLGRPRTWLASLAVAGAALIGWDRLLMPSICVVSSSMSPTILANERGWITKATGSFHRFDVVVAQDATSDIPIIKRIVGLPGERVRLVDSYRVYINGHPLDYEPVGENIYREEGHHVIATIARNGGPFPTQFGAEDLELGPDEYFLLGDNRWASEDGRVFGPKHVGDLLGKLKRIWFSYDLNQNRMRWDRILHDID